MASALEKIADLLVQKGLLTREQLEACIREVNESQGTSKPLLLSDVIISKGYADRPTLAQTVQFLAEVKFRCSKCRTPYNIRSPKIDGSYICKRCGAPLETEDIALSQGAPSAPGAPGPKPGGPPPEVAEAAKDPKRVMGKYTLVIELGRGGMAVVYKAWDQQLDQFVALKLIRSQDIGLSDQPEDATVQEFLREARTAVKLQHQNIVRVYELGRHGDRYFLSMEYVQGKSLAQLLRTSRETRALPFYADVKRYLGYLRDVALALDYSHRRTPPIVHRDIKPQNILVEDGGRVCVVDFGLAKELMGAGSLTRSGVAKGTPCYMAPEQATGKPIDARTDVYALGAILYECMTGQPPFTGPSERDILNKILGEEAAPPTAVLKGKGIIAPALPDLERICLKALEKPKERRYKSAGEFAEDLERFLEGQSVQARPISGLERSWRWLMKRKAVAISTASAVLMALVAALVLLRDKNERIVERVKIVGDVDPEKKAALEAIDRLEVQFRYEAAARACEDLLRKVREEGQRTPLRQRRDDLRLQAEFFKGLASRIGPGIPEQSNFRLIGEPPFEARFLEADAESLRFQRAGRPTSVAWARVEPRQMVALAKVAWPEMDGKSTLAMGVWCLRQGLSEEATTFFSRPGAAVDASESKRYQEELRSKELKSGLSDAEQVTRLVSEAEQALAKEDAIIARARFERALVLSKDDPRILHGLEKVAELEKRQEAARAPTPEPASPSPESTSKSTPLVAEKLPDSKSADSVAVSEFGASQSKLFLALRKGDFSGAAARWDEAQKTLGPRAVRFTRLPGALDLKAGRPLLDEVETWLSSTTGDDNLALRQVFALRDLLAMSLALGDFHAAVDRLIQRKVEVPLYSLEMGKEKRGTFERTQGKLYFNEMIDVGGQKGTFGTPIGLRSEDGQSLAGWDVANILGIDRKLQGSADPDRRLGEVLLISYSPADVLRFLEELEKDVSGKPEAQRFRLKEYLECRRELARAEPKRNEVKADEPMPAAAGPKAAPAPAPPAPAPKDPVPAAAAGKAETAEEGIRRGIVALRSLQQKTEPFTYAGRRMRYTELLLWTFLNAGVPANDSDVQLLLKEMLLDKLESTFCVSLQAMILERLDRVKYQKRIWQCGQFLVDNQTAQGGWGYGSPSIYVEDWSPPTSKKLVLEKKRDGEGADLVNTFFAALALRACRDAGAVVPRIFVDRSLQYIRSSHKSAESTFGQPRPKNAVGDPRGWCYEGHAEHKAYGSTTAASLAAQAIWTSLWDDDGGKRASFRKDKDVQDGVAWLLLKYSVKYNPGPYEHGVFEENSKNQYYFYLFALDQAMVLLGIDDLGGHLWHAEGTKELLENQSRDGSWSGFTAVQPVGPADMRARYAASNVADTCFAILFLKRSGQPLPDTSKQKK